MGVCANGIRKSICTLALNDYYRDFIINFLSQTHFVFEKMLLSLGTFSAGAMNGYC